MLSSATNASTASARACERVAKSVTPMRLRAGSFRSPPMVIAMGSPARLSDWWTIEKSRGRGKDGGLRGTGWRLGPGPPGPLSAKLLQPYYNAVGRAPPVDHGEAYETGPRGRKEQRAAARAGLR